MTVLFENLAHNLLYIFIRDLCGLLVEEINLLLVNDIDVSSKIMAVISRYLGEFGYRRTGMRVGLKGSDENERLTVFWGSASFSVERDSLLGVLSLSDILEWQYWPRDSWYGARMREGNHSGLRRRNMRES